MTALLELHRLVLGYGRSIVIRGADLSLAKGERICILGGNGSGKSTLLKAIAGFVEPWEGEVRFEGRSMNGVPPYGRFAHGIVYVPQDRRLFGQKSVTENLRLGCISQNCSVQETDQRIDRVCSYFPMLREKANERAAALSGGEQQALAVGRALMGGPRLLLLDEPSAGLAPVWIDRLFDALQAVVTDYGLTMVLVEQNVHVGLDLTERGCVIQNGSVMLDQPSHVLRGSEQVIRSYLGG